MDKTGIYKITNPESKVYIGQSVNIRKRHNNYRIGNSIGPKLLKSFNTFGFLNHKIEIIEECTLDILDERERFWKEDFINKYGWENALFYRLKDRKGGKHKPETIEKMRKSHLGKKYSEESKQKMKKPKTQEHKNNISNGKKGKENLKSRKQVGQYSLDGNLIKIWECIRYAEKELNLWNGGISACIHGRQKECGGFLWKLIENN